MLLRNNRKLLAKNIPFYEIEPYKITGTQGTRITATNDSRVITRNASFFKKVPARAKTREPQTSETNLEIICEDFPPAEVPDLPADNTNGVVEASGRYNLRRNVKPPSFLIDEL